MSRIRFLTKALADFRAAPPEPQEPTLREAVEVISAWNLDKNENRFLVIDGNGYCWFSFLDGAQTRSDRLSGACTVARVLDELRALLPPKEPTPLEAFQKLTDDGWLRHGHGDEEDETLNALLAIVRKGLEGK